MVTRTLSEKMLLYGQLKLQVMELEGQIKTEVLSLKETQAAGNVRAVYSEGRGSYNWLKIAAKIDPPTEVIEIYTTETVDWRKVCDKVGVAEDIKNEFFKAGNPTVSLKIEAK